MGIVFLSFSSWLFETTTTTTISNEFGTKKTRYLNFFIIMKIFHLFFFGHQVIIIIMIIINHVKKGTMFPNETTEFNQTEFISCFFFLPKHYHFLCFFILFYLLISFDCRMLLFFPGSKIIIIIKQQL